MNHRASILGIGSIELEEQRVSSTYVDAHAHAYFGAIGSWMLCGRIEHNFANRKDPKRLELEHPFTPEQGKDTKVSGTSPSVCAHYTAYSGYTQSPKPQNPVTHVP